MSENADHLAVLSLKGPQASEFIQGYVTSDVATSIASSAQPTTLTDIRGRVIGNGWLFSEPNKINLVIHASVVELVASHLTKYLIFAKADLAAPVSPLYLTESRTTRWPQLEPFAWSLSEEPATLKYHTLLVDKGHALVTAATSGMFLPQMLGLTQFGAVSFSKGCYLGQEVVARAEHRGAVKRQLATYRWSGDSLSPGEKASANGRGNGVVITHDSHHALVVVTGEAPELQSSGAVLERA